MIVDLLSSFGSILSKQRKLPEDEKQVVFSFPSPPNVVVVDSLSNLKPVSAYGELSSHVFTEEETGLIENTKNEIEAAGGYDGDQVLIEDLGYEQSSNTVYLSLKKVKYSFIRTLRKPEEEGGFSSSSEFYNKPFFTAGVRAPFITTDGTTVLLKRANPPKVYSVAAGHFELREEGIFPEKIVEKLACEEAIEECLAKESAIAKSLGVMSIAMRLNGLRVEIEFIVPLVLTYNSLALRATLQAELAPDAHEHVKEDVRSIPLSSVSRSMAVHTLKSFPSEGGYVRSPLIEAASRGFLLNKHRAPDFVSRFPFSKTRFFPACALFPRIFRLPRQSFSIEESALEEKKEAVCSDRKFTG